MDSNNKKESSFKEELITGLIMIALFCIVFFGFRGCVNSCSSEDEFENDEFYNQSIGRQIMMEKMGMKEEAQREKEMRRAYRREHSK